MTGFPAGLPDRRSLQTSLGTLREKACGRGHDLFSLLADPGGLKPVKDQEGPPQGARLPCAVADALSCALRPRGTLGRPGGDECVLAGSGGRDAGARLAQRAAPAIRWGAGLAFGCGTAARPADRALGESKRKSHESRTFPGVRAAAESRGHGR